MKLRSCDNKIQCGILDETLEQKKYIGETNDTI